VYGRADRAARTVSLARVALCWRVLQYADAMADVVNLNRFRKRKRRDADQREAEQNRVVHGRSKAEKQALRLERERAERSLAAHEREPGDVEDSDAADPTP
jgi:hypothetical protein